MKRPADPHTDAALAALANGAAGTIDPPAPPPPPVQVRRGFAPQAMQPKTWGRAAPTRCATCGSDRWSVPQWLARPWGAVIVPREGTVWRGVCRATGPYETRTCRCGIQRRYTMLAAEGVRLIPRPLNIASWAAGTQAEAWLVSLGRADGEVEACVHEALVALNLANADQKHAHDRAALARWLTRHPDDAAWWQALSALSLDNVKVAAEFVLATRHASLAWFDEWTERGAEWHCLWTGGRNGASTYEAGQWARARNRARRDGRSIEALETLVGEVTL